MHLGNYSTGSTVFFIFTTVGTTGAPIAFSSGGVTVYSQSNATENTTGITFTATHDGRVGLNHVMVEMAGNSTFYLPGQSYMAIISSGITTVADLSGYSLAHWTIRQTISSVTTSVNISSTNIVLSVSSAVTLSSASYVNVSSTQIVLSVSSAVTISTAALISTANVFNISATNTILSVSSAVGSVGSTVDAHVRAIGGSSLAAENVRFTMGAIGRVTVDAGSSSTAIQAIVASITPALVVADQFKGRVGTFDEGTTTTALRGQSFIIGSISTLGIFVSSDALTTAPSSGDLFSIT